VTTGATQRYGLVDAFLHRPRPTDKGGEAEQKQHFETGARDADAGTFLLSVALGYYYGRARR
jgi:hypothetical protein